jgi:hypothetical protein
VPYYLQYRRNYAVVLDIGHEATHVHFLLPYQVNDAKRYFANTQ